MSERKSTERPLEELPKQAADETPTAYDEESQAGNTEKSPAEDAVNFPVGSSMDSDLLRKLKEVGLSPKIWLQRFKTLLGVKTALVLEYLGPEDYLKIEKLTNFPWEKQALKKLFKITDPSVTLKQAQDEKDDKIKKNQDEGRKELGELKKMLTEGKTHLDKVEKQKEEASWVTEKETLQVITEKLHKELDVNGKALSNKENLPDHDLFLHASGGLALEGIYMTMKQEDILKKREQLIIIPNDLCLTGPQQGPVLEQKEFTSSSDETTFHQSMERLGFSITCSAKGSFPGFQAEASTSYTKSKNTEQRQRCHTEDIFICTTKYNYIPLASCYISKDQIHLSSAAINELKSIEELVKHCAAAEKTEFKRHQYGNFFSRFGSHANQGPLHFGGIFWWKATSKGFKEEKMEEMKREISDALNAYVGCGYVGGFNAAFGGDVTKTHSDNTHDGTSKKDLKKHIELFVTKTGGPLDADSLSTWKEGLVASNKTWSVIDRGFSLIPVWEIILSVHKEDFIDAHEVSSDLINAYQAITNQHPSLMFGDNLAKAIDEAKSFLSGLQSWEVGCAELQLMKLINFKQKLNEMTGSYNVWVNVCLPHKALHDFLEKTIEFIKNIPQSEMCVIQSQIKFLLQHYDYSDKNITSYSSISNWAYQSREEQKPINISEFSTFIDALCQEKDILQAIQSPNTSEEEMYELNKKASINIQACMISFFKTLRQVSNTDLELLILSAASIVGYSVRNHYFHYHLEWQDICFMVKEIQNAYNEYQRLQGLPAYRQQAFILFTGLTAGRDFKPVSIEMKRDLLQFMVDKMSCSLAQETLSVLEKYNEFGDLQSLKQDLHHLISGNYEDAIKLNTKNIANKIKSICQISKEEGAIDASTSQPNHQHRITVQTTEITLNQEFSNLIKSLGLQNYFPRNLNRTNLQMLSSSSVNQPETESDLPSCFLQMLMTLDYRFRYLVCIDERRIQISSNTSTLSEEINKTFYTIDDFFNNISKDEKNVTAMNKESIHPMDLQMAIYHCADDFLRQYIFSKLSLCQFALPFIVPTADGSGLELPLWSFRQVQKSIIYTDSLGKTKHKEKMIYDVEFPVVCFRRFGHSDFSKSQILNNLLNKHKHDIFYHRDCKGSTKDSILMEGLVEIFWFCPDGKDDEQSVQGPAFVNLHGDLRAHRRQAAFLQEIASINVVIFSESDKNETGTKMFLDILNSKKPLICLCPDRETSTSGNNNCKMIIGLKNRNEAELMKELETTLRRLLALSPQSLSLEACAEIARRHGFLVDEDRKECVEGKMHAQTMLNLLKGNDKNALLPLSGTLWHSWCKLDTELTCLQNKTNRSIEQHKSEVESKKKSIRAEQLKMAAHNPFTIPFITIMKTLPKTTKMFFLQWLKIFINDLFCDRIVELRDQYNCLWSSLQTEENKRLENALHDNIEHVTKEMNDCMIGLERLLREVGQTYEALYELQYKDESFCELPKIAAEMMTSGYPIELMDGDASYVPLKWIGAVFGELIKMLGDKKLFVLSVLGVQSSGKSTLLNTMFGLQFAVSAGRCTRGAFMQLIQIDEELKKALNFDYILVIDTEGLRTMELANLSSLNHDNKLATFVIGVGNMTLINVFGENPSEITDILQIVVQAFLRMKQVKLSPSCLFIHQNVGEITALNKNVEGGKDLQNELDKITRLAAEQEHCDIQYFRDVIKFDVKSHIRYFAHLWEGNPPMAAPNPIYSQNALKVRNLILQPGKRHCQQDVLSISELKVRIEDLWSALRNENFVFSFKNTLEISAYRKVEKKYRQWTWKLRCHILQLQVKLINKIKRGEINSVKCNELQDQVKETHNAIMEDLEIFFNDDKDKEIVIQWRTSTENRLKNLQTELLEETEKQVKEHVLLKQRQNKINMKAHEDELLRRSKQLALKIKNNVLDEDALREHFSLLWQEWVAEISTTVPCVENPNIASDLEDIILEYFKQEPSICDKLNDFCKRRSISFDPPKHVSEKEDFFTPKNLEKDDDEYFEQVITDLTKKTKAYIHKIKKENMNYNKEQFHHIINEVENYENPMSNLSKNFKMATTFKIDLSLYLCHMAMPVFDEIQQAFQRTNNPLLILKNKREQFYNSFRIYCQGANAVKTFADLLCSKLLVAIRPAVYHRATLAVVDEMTKKYPAFSSNRTTLEIYILIYLAEQEDFEKYEQYLHTPEKTFECFIEKQVNEYCLEKDSFRLKRFFNISLDYFQKLVISAISKSTQFTKDKSSGVSEWLDVFYTEIKDEISFSRADLESIEHQEIQDPNSIKEVMCNTWDTKIGSFRQKFNEKSFDAFDTKPHTILTKQLGGCWEQCPFCRAICTNSIPGHDGDHSVPFHRFNAINGYKWLESNEFVTDICSSLVVSDANVHINNTLKIPYRQYRKIGPNYKKWRITPDTSSQPYWKWFVSHFRTNLENCYGCKFEGKGDIPVQWEKITKREVIAELMEHVSDQHQQIKNHF
ncbi:interferon-induced very large GTPase 1-like [Rhinophrynus dorsalis]